MEKDIVEARPTTMYLRRLSLQTAVDMRRRRHCFPLGKYQRSDKDWDCTRHFLKIESQTSVIYFCALKLEFINEKTSVCSLSIYRLFEKAAYVVVSTS